MKTLVLGKAAVGELLNMSDTIAAVEDAYRTFQLGAVIQPPIMSIDVPENHGELDVKACYSKDNSTISVKTAVGYWHNKQDYNLPTLLATIVLYDAKSGFPLCIMDGSLITGYRTGAAGAISAKYSARKDAKTVAIIGAGGQARMQALALKEVMDFETIRVWSASVKGMEDYKAEIEKTIPVKVIPCGTPDEATSDADIVITTTPSNKAIVKAGSLKAGTHIVAIGADMEGKQELDPELFRNARIVVDSVEQCLQRGETRNPFVAGVISREDIYAEIGELLLKQKTGRTNDAEITIFDATGMGIQDNAVAKMIYDKALDQGKGQKLDLF